jgi:hypothetical protein
MIQLLMSFASNSTPKEVAEKNFQHTGESRVLQFLKGLWSCHSSRAHATAAEHVPQQQSTCHSSRAHATAAEHVPQQQSMCHKAESQDFTAAQRSEILEVHQATGHIPIPRLHQPVTRGQIQHSSITVHRLLSNTAYDLSPAVICEPYTASNQTRSSFPRSSDNGQIYQRSMLAHGYVWTFPCTRSKRGAILPIAYCQKPQSSQWQRQTCGLQFRVQSIPCTQGQRPHSQEQRCHFPALLCRLCTLISTVLKGLCWRGRTSCIYWSACVRWGTTHCATSSSYASDHCRYSRTTSSNCWPLFNSILTAANKNKH